jgi:hypothetical protein
MNDEDHPSPIFKWGIIGMCVVHTTLASALRFSWLTTLDAVGDNEDLVSAAAEGDQGETSDDEDSAGDSEAPVSAAEQGDTSDHDSTASSPEQRPPRTAEVQQQSRCSSSEPPHDLTCPITCALLVDPVITVADGETYERAAIEAWFGEGHDTSPITGERLDSSALVPNNAMKRLIVQWQDCEALSRAFAFFA